MPPRPFNNAALPAKFTCRVCGKEKPAAEYSKNQIQKWHNQKRNDRGNFITPQNAGLSCMEHQNSGRVIRCGGPCDRSKAVEYFSKNQRNNTDPWCIDCTEWRLEFAGHEVPTSIPNGPLAYGPYGAEVDDGEPTRSALSSSQDDEEDSSDDEDGTSISPYDGPTSISSLIDRLEGYGGLAEKTESTTADTMSVANSVKISLWDEETDAGGNDSGSENSADTVTGMQPWRMQNSGTFIGVPMVPNPDRHGSTLRSHSSAADSSTTASTVSTPAGVAPHLNRLASRTNMNHQTQTPRVNQFMDSGESTQSMPNRMISGRLPPGPKSKEEAKRGALHLADRVPSTQSGRGAKNQWFKGDNRKVFTNRKRYLPDAAQDRTEEPHDSDSPDEM
ncbi:Stc1 domain-containing protein [Nemania sp. NC0429]|nr:Stc1 domain-containing protein [Nemania sp. NC0429]